MGTRKLRLLHLAYLRGNGNLIRADYPQGVRSVLRESMILSALSMQGVAEHGRATEAAITSALAPHYDKKKLKEVCRNLLQELWRLHRVEQLDYVALRKSRPQGSVDGIAKIYHALEKSKFFDMVREAHFRINPEERHRG